MPDSHYNTKPSGGLAYYVRPLNGFVMTLAQLKGRQFQLSIYVQRK
jgi:hypothetical protein